MQSTTVKTSQQPTQQQSEEKQENNSKLAFEVKPVENTPFVKRYVEEKGWSYGIAEHRIGEWYKTEKEVDEKLKGIKKGQLDWDLITAVVLILAEKQEEMRKMLEATK